MVYDFAETLITAQGAGTAVTGTTRTTLLPTQALYPLPAGFFDYAGKQLLIMAKGQSSTDSGAPGTFRFDVNFLNSAAVDAIVFDSTVGVPMDTVGDATNVNWELELLLTCRGPIGTANFLLGQGRLTAPNILGLGTAQPKASISAMLPWATAPVVGQAFNSTLSQIVDLRFTQTAAGTSPVNSIQLLQYSLIRLN